MSAAVRDPALPWISLLADRGELASLLSRMRWLREPDGASAALRLRWKPGTNLRVGAVVPTAHGAAAVLIGGFAPGSRGKADRLTALAARDVPVHREGSVVAVPACADPDLHGLVPHGVPLSYNPARRWVGRVDDHAIKVHATSPPVGVTRLLTGPSRLLAEHLPAVEVRAGGRVVHSRWTPGAPPGLRDLPAVREALNALHATAAPAGLPALDSRAVLAAAQHAGRSVVTTLPTERARVATLIGVLRRACLAGRWPAPTSLVHGDFSPDQVVVSDGRAVLLDLDRACSGPTGWDAAQWGVAQLAAGVPRLPAPVATSPILVLAAALLRAPEPFRRLRPGWPQLTRGVLDTAGAAALEAS